MISPHYPSFPRFIAHHSPFTLRFLVFDIWEWRLSVCLSRFPSNYVLQQQFRIRLRDQNAFSCISGSFKKDPSRKFNFTYKIDTNNLFASLALDCRLRSETRRLHIIVGHIRFIRSLFIMQFSFLFLLL